MRFAMPHHSRIVRALAVCATIVALTILRGPSPARAADPPYLKLAQALGTPDLANSAGPKDRSTLLLHFVRGGDVYPKWTKMTTVSIVKIPEGDTENATRGIIDRLYKRLKSTHVKIVTFDRSPIAPVTSYFVFRLKNESDAGIVYSPSPGYVTVAQLEARGREKISSDDIAALKAVIGK